MISSSECFTEMAIWHGSRPLGNPFTTHEGPDLGIAPVSGTSPTANGPRRLCSAAKLTWPKRSG